jgi:hypothetical protein
MSAEPRRASRTGHMEAAPSTGATQVGAGRPRQGGEQGMARLNCLDEECGGHGVERIRVHGEDE